MTDPDRRLTKSPRLPKDVKEARRAAELRANLQRRKMRARAPTADDPHPPPGAPTDAPTGGQRVIGVPADRSEGEGGD